MTSPVLSRPAGPSPVRGPGPRTGYEETLARLQQAYAALPPGAPVRLGKPTSNLFRPRERVRAARLDAGELTGVLAVDVDGPAPRTCSA